jgi:hypothetical protein
MATLAIVAACVGGESAGPGTPDPATSPSSSADASRPVETPGGDPSPTASSGDTPTPVVASSPPGVPSDACSESDANRVFFRQAAASMAWSVYCAALGDGWFVDAGSFHLADGGRLEVTYRGPDGARFALVEGNVCDGEDVETCAPRDAVIAQATFGDRDGTLGRLANGLVLDVDRGANPSWRATGLGLTEDAFRAFCAGLIAVEG